MNDRRPPPTCVCDFSSPLCCWRFPAETSWIYWGKCSERLRPETQTETEFDDELLIQYFNQSAARWHRCDQEDISCVFATVPPHAHYCFHHQQKATETLLLRSSSLSTGNNLIYLTRCDAETLTEKMTKWHNLDQPAALIHWRQLIISSNRWLSWNGASQTTFCSTNELMQSQNFKKGPDWETRRLPHKYDQIYLILIRGSQK